MVGAVGAVVGTSPPVRRYTPAVPLRQLLPVRSLTPPMHEAVGQRRRSELRLEMRKTLGSRGSAASVVRGRVHAAPRGQTVQAAAGAEPLLSPLLSPLLKKPATQKQSRCAVEPRTDLGVDSVAIGDFGAASRQH